jgi:hypothetical protein
MPSVAPRTRSRAEAAVASQAAAETAATQALDRATSELARAEQAEEHRDAALERVRSAESDRDQATTQALLPSHEPELWESLQPPATGQALELLRLSVALFEVPTDWIELLRWHNGGPWDGPWWPILECGHILGTTEVIEHYRWLCENTEEWQWHRSWLPIAHEGWSQCGIDGAGDEQGHVVDGSFPGAARRIAPSVPAVLHTTCATIEAGMPSRPTEFSGATYDSWRASRDAVVKATYEEYGEWVPMTVHVHALLPDLRKKLSEHPRISRLEGPDVRTIAGKNTSRSGGTTETRAAQQTPLFERTPSLASRHLTQ